MGGAVKVREEGGRSVGYLGVLAGREELMARREPLLSVRVNPDHLHTHTHIENFLIRPCIYMYA